MRAYKKPGREPCSVGYCDKPRYCKGLCTRHYSKLRALGSIEDSAGDHAPLRVRIERLREVNEETGCWDWLGSFRGGGYARMSVKNRVVPAHRVSFEVFRYPVPNGLVLDHLCRDRGCVNPWHLEPVTIGENTLRSPTAPSALNFLKTECKNGHLFTKENTYLRPTGGRSCKTCRATRQRESVLRKLAKSA